MPATRDLWWAHLAREPDARRLVRVGLCKSHAQHEHAALRRLGREESELPAVRWLGSADRVPSHFDRHSSRAGTTSGPGAPPTTCRQGPGGTAVDAGARVSKRFADTPARGLTSTVAAHTKRLSSLCGAALQPRSDINLNAADDDMALKLCSTRLARAENGPGSAGRSAGSTPRWLVRHRACCPLNRRDSMVQLSLAPALGRGLVARPHLRRVACRQLARPCTPVCTADKRSNLATRLVRRHL